MINFFNISHFVILFFGFVLTDLTISNKSVKQNIRNIWFAFLTPDIKKFYAQGSNPALRLEKPGALHMSHHLMERFPPPPNQSIVKTLSTVDNNGVQQST